MARNDRLDNDAPAARRYLEELLACRGVEEEVLLRSRFGFMAFHGGSLEQHTDTIASAAAEAAQASLYVVRQPPNLRWHIPSTLFRPEESPKLHAFLNGVDVVLTIHGFRRKAFPQHVLLGGRNRRLARHVAATLQPMLPNYVIEHELERIPEPIRGLRADNPVNLPRFGGVQVELPPAIRGGHSFLRGEQATLVGHASDPERLVAGLAEVARTFRP